MGNKELFIEFYKNSFSIGDIDPSIWLSNYIVDRMELNKEQIIWFCFLNSITYHLPTAYLIINEYPDLENIEIDKMMKWWQNVYQRCPFQKDKIKQRKQLPETVQTYLKSVGVSQVDFFDKLLQGSETENFDNLFKFCENKIKHFGRFSIWNFCQMLKQVAGYKVFPDKLLLGEKSSKAHTEGICLASDYPIKDLYSQDEKNELELKGSKIFEEIQSLGLFIDNYFLETLSCAFKKIFRNRESRYVGYYLDRQAIDIQEIEKNGWDGVNWDLLWQARLELISWDNRFIDKSRFNLEVNEKIKLPTGDYDIWG